MTKFDTGAFDALKDAKDNYQHVVRNKAKDAVIRLARQFRGAHPEVTGIQWEQYTPHWDHGELCYFSVNGISVRFKAEDGESDQDADFICGEALEYDENLSDAFQEDLDKVNALLKSAEDALELTFGDGVLVTVTDDGIEVDDCEHE